jgi:chorismate-pyruvate lyase
VPEATLRALELDSLIRLFYDDAAQLGDFSLCAADEMPPAYHQLLAHSAHMTVTVEKRHGCSVDVEVLECVEQNSHYLRKILLHRTSDQKVVQFGIVRLALGSLDEAPRQEILAKQTPLGRVLIKHNVMRHVELLGLWQVRCGRELAAFFDASLGQITYGRTALIHCNGEPAVELLEIVAPEPPSALDSSL